MIENVIVLGLASYRLSRLLAHEDGPFDIFLNLRRWLGTANPTSVSMMLSALFHCPYCLGVWVSAGLSLVLAQSFAEWVLYWLGSAAVQTLLQVFEDSGAE